MSAHPPLSSTSSAIRLRCIADTSLMPRDCIYEHMRPNRAGHKTLSHIRIQCVADLRYFLDATLYRRFVTRHGLESPSLREAGLLPETWSRRNVRNWAIGRGYGWQGGSAAPHGEVSTLGEHGLPCGEFGRRCATGASLPSTARLTRVRLAVVCYAARASPLWPNRQTLSASRPSVCPSLPVSAPALFASSTHYQISPFA